MPAAAEAFDNAFVFPDPGGRPLGRRTASSVPTSSADFAAPVGFEAAAPDLAADIDLGGASDLAGCALTGATDFAGAANFAGAVAATELGASVDVTAAPVGFTDGEDFVEFTDFAGVDAGVAVGCGADVGSLVSGDLYAAADEGAACKVCIRLQVYCRADLVCVKGDRRQTSHRGPRQKHNAPRTKPQQSRIKSAQS